MTFFIPVNYNNKPYPYGIRCSVREIAGHLDKESIRSDMPYSLHTEYSFGKRALNSRLLGGFPELKRRNKAGVPQLWYDKAWAAEFAEFILALMHSDSGGQEPIDIEIHPPFKEYCASMEEFLERYAVFENKIRTCYPSVGILLENRSGSRYPGSRFLLSELSEITDFLQELDSSGCILKMVIDYPQIFTAEQYDLTAFPFEDFAKKHEQLNPYRNLIGGIHLWGKLRNANGRWIAHNGDLNSLFNGNQDVKQRFLNLLYEFYHDNVPRFFVPEVNSAPEHLQSIVSDLISAGIRFYT